MSDLAMCPCFVGAEALGADRGSGRLFMGPTLWVLIGGWQCAFCGSTLSKGTTDMIPGELAAAWRLGGADMVLNILDDHPGEYHEVRHRLDRCTQASAAIGCLDESAIIDRRPLVWPMAGATKDAPK